MISSLLMAVRQLPDPAFRQVIWRSLVLSALLFAGLVAGAWWLVSAFATTGWGWLDRMIAALGEVAAVVLAVALYPGAVTLVASFLLEDVAAAVEARHYPDLPPPRAQPWWEIAWFGLRFAAVAIGLNLLMLPITVASLIVPSFLAFLLPLIGVVSLMNIFVFYALNGYLLGREYFELAAHRRLDPRTARRLRRRNWGRVNTAGIVAAGLLSIPIVNLIMPVVAAALMVHQFEFMRRRAGGQGAVEDVRT